MRQDAEMIIVGKYDDGLDLFTDRPMDFTTGAESGEQRETVYTISTDTYSPDLPSARLSEMGGYVLMVVTPH